MSLINIFTSNKHGKNQLIVLEGIHAIKHALRFNADLKTIISPHKASVLKIYEKLAPDIIDKIKHKIEDISEKTYDQIFPNTYHEKIAALALKPQNSDALNNSTIVWLEDTSSTNNIGATIRILAARGIKNLIITGQNHHTIWNNTCLRTSAGLHFALNNIKTFSNSTEAINFIKSNKYKLISISPEGAPIKSNPIQPNHCLVFGNERNGVQEYTKKHSDLILSIPMEPKVSSLNLATSVSATLYFNYPYQP